MNAALAKIAKEYKIPPEQAERLRKLQDFEIVIVCDDSGSMTTKVDGTDKTRWNELCEIVKIIVDIGVVFDSNGVDIHFLNRDSFHNVKDPETIDEAFETIPSGYTPLVPVLSEIFGSQLAHHGRDKKLLVFVATDGEPTDTDDNLNVNELGRLMQETRQPATTYVSFLLCTDNPHSVEYLREWDRTMENVDVTDDFITEREKIRQCCGDNYHFSHGDYVIKALIGAIDPEIDKTDEPR